MKIKFYQLTSVLIVAFSWNLLAAAGITEEQLTPLELSYIEEKRFKEIPTEVQALLQSTGQNPISFDDEELLNRIHNDAYYAPMAISGNADVIQLNDGSHWSVHPYQREIIRHWVQTDIIFIKPKSSCFSNYAYVLQNRSTRETVEVNLIGAPQSMSSATRWIVNLEPRKKLIQLNDNTIWQINQDDYTFRKWHIGQLVLVGVNNHWRIAQFPHILINTALYGVPYSEAEFIGYPTY
ncbi:hypothetical protein [Candidatus Protochlamydia sp. W-9]|uniref:hypothetical protein n=1 Tax=Candidatus Protochlamydia sp. W-9 TaxID=1785087 RepID=UPI00096AC174|nr:hypothetical protein [Candidatus Protochlamydia sp. W-9]